MPRAERPTSTSNGLTSPDSAWKRRLRTGPALFIRDDRERTVSDWRKATLELAPYEVAHSLRSKDGEYRWFLARGTTHLSPEGVVWFGTCTDIQDLKAAQDQVFNQQGFLTRLLEGIEDCVKVLDLGGRITFISEGGRRVMEVDDFEAVRLRYWPDNWSDAATRARAVEACEIARAGGVGRFQGPAATLKGTPKWWDVQVTGIRGADGDVERLLAISRDMTQLRTYDEKLRLTHERLGLALDAGSIAAWSWDMRSGLIQGDERLARMFGLDPEAVERGVPVEAFLSAIHPADVEQTKRVIEEATTVGGAYEYEFRVVRGGETRWYVARGKTQHDAAGRPMRMPATTIDITELREATEAKDLLARELSHRIKNLFALVIGLVGLLARTAGTQLVPDFARSLAERLTALSRAFDLVRPSGDGRKPEVSSLRALGCEIVKPYGDRVRFEGDDVQVGPKAATSIALILHELATNSLKYGSLSALEGVVHASGELRGETYSLTWTEAGGPRVLAPPEHKGFGSILMGRSVTGSLGGDVEMDWSAEGLCVRMRVPVTRLSQ